MLTNKNEDGRMRKKKKVLEIDGDGNLKVANVAHEKNEKTDDWRGLRYMNLGYYIVVPLLGGVLLGIVLDRGLKVHYFTLVGIVIGVVASFYNLWKLVSDSEKKNF